MRPLSSHSEIPPPYAASQPCLLLLGRLGCRVLRKAVNIEVNLRGLLELDKSDPNGDLDNSTSNVLIPLDSWTSGLLVYKLPLSVQPPPVPFPRRLRKEKDEAQQKKFLENLNQTGNERCSTILLNKLPLKEKDPGSFTIPCDIGQLHIDNALADLGASISLMPYMMYKKLSLGEPKATRMSLELTDGSIQYLRGIIENVLIKVDKFVLPIDFIILDMPEDSRVPIILGRPFLATARAMIDVFNKKITLGVGDDEVVFDVDQSIKRPTTEDDECYGIDDLDETINEEAKELPDSFLSRGLEKSINQSDLE
ncbi:DNA-directed DNA polymerase [Tanacetum coccineum]